MPDYLAHLQRPAVLSAETAWARHVHGGPDAPGCPDCQQGERRACPAGQLLHEEVVQAAHRAYEEAQGGRG